MSEPRRLLEEGGDDLAASLLRSARRDAPSARSRQATLAALGLGAGAAVTAAAATSSAATAATASSLAKSAGTAALLKWIGVGVVGGLVTVTTVAVVQSPEPKQEPVAVIASAAPKPIAPPPKAIAPAPTAAPAEPSAAPEAPPEPPKSARPVVSVEKPEPAEKPSLADEVASLDAARAALASGNAAGALRALDDHDRRFAGGALGPEATVLRIEALALRGDRGSAAALARAFLAAHPRSPHAARIRSVALPNEEPAP